VIEFEAVIFDFHSTLADGGDTGDWIDGAARRLGRPAPPGPRRDRLRAYLDDLWQHAHTIDPKSDRDLSPELHRDVFERTMALCPDADAGLTSALYDTMTAQWRAFDDAAPALRSLRSHGLKIAVLSNVGLDIRDCLVRDGLDTLVDEVVLSYEVGVVKPDPAVFAIVLERLGTSGDRTLMVGDSARDDTGGATLGIRTLILPRTRGRVHGLDAVARLVRRSPDT
jgi:HAD superfamily hydrolase (TIGR01493 family)